MKIMGRETIVPTMRVMMREIMKKEMKKPPR
jgi:hypothetical protein